MHSDYLLLCPVDSLEYVFPRTMIPLFKLVWLEYQREVTMSFLKMEFNITSYGNKLQKCRFLKYYDIGTFFYSGL